MHEVRHGFPGMLGSLDCMNHLFNNVSQGNAHEVNFTANDTQYKKGYYLTDGIYPTWTAFVKSFPCPDDPNGIFLRKDKRPQEKMSNELLGCSKLDGQLFEDQLVNGIRKK
ncbi:hypothetical protein ACS0TY_020016 [Phlomoides rotata]